MTASRTYDFETHAPIELYVELGRGSVRLTATETSETHVEILGQAADQVEVRHEGDRVSVVAPRQRTGFFTSESRLDVSVSLPRMSQLGVRTGSADVLVTGTVGSSEIKSGSGRVRLEDLAGPALVETGSGDVTIEAAHGELRVKSGSGGVEVGHAEGASAISTGSGDVQIGTARGPAAVKTGSGDLQVSEAHTDVSMTTGSGDLRVDTAHRGRFTVKGASGDVRLGIPCGVPVWTDIATITGTIRNELQRVGEPTEDADHVELRAKTVSGDIVLTQA